MGKSIIHYRWSAKRSLVLVLSLTLTLISMPSILTPSSVSHRPVNRQDLHKLISLNHPQPELVSSIINTESNWDSNAVSSKGAIGLMQVMPASARMVGLNYSKEDLKCPEKNIIAGTRILKYYQRTSRTLEEALDKYSGGATNYYQKVMRRMKS